MNMFEVVQNINNSRSNASIHIFFYLNIVNCNLFMIFSRLIKYFLMNLMISFVTWWFLILSINWFIVSSDHLRFIDFIFLLIHFWDFFILIVKIFKFCYIWFWWAADEHYTQILTSRTNSTAKSFKQLCYYNIRSPIVLNF